MRATSSRKRKNSSNGPMAKLKNLAMKPEIDLGGMMTDEAIPIMERFLTARR